VNAARSVVTQLIQRMIMSGSAVWQITNLKQGTDIC